MKKQRIVLASILKPVDDTRMFEKIAGTLSKVNDYAIFVIGYPSQNKNNSHKSITQLPLKPFKRLSLGRMLAPWQVLLKTYKVKPEVLVVNTHELLIVSIINRILFGTNIVYDIRENYWRNILYTRAFPSSIRFLMASWVRLKEKLTAPFFHSFFLAEKTYEQELTFVTGKQIVLENKTLVQETFKRTSIPGKIQLLFSGTLADSTGVFRAIELGKNLHEIDPRVELKIIGYCALTSTLQRIQKSIGDHPFITLVGGHELVPHDKIFEAIASADFGIIAYPPSAHIESRIPTKLYEYLACQLPIILQDYEPWVKLSDRCNAAIVIQFKDYNPEEVLSRIATTSFYTSNPRNVTWETEEPKLLEKMAKILA
ncbi:MAG: glycosyltransferase [Cyclobacteriaceae bacterium]|nr:glycosyltransferase [Cyclobacteriaceae bacterium]